MADALFAACFLNTCLRNAKDVKMACFSSVVNASGALFVYPEGVVKRTMFHVFSLYANKLQPNIVPSVLISDSLTSREMSVPAVDALVTSNTRKNLLTLVLVNKDPGKEADCDLGIDIIGGFVKAWVLSGDSPDAYNDIDTPDRVIPQSQQLNADHGHIIIPAHSLAIITVPLRE
jgi:alpha-L-arabinofuranosidase